MCWRSVAEYTVHLAEFDSSFSLSARASAGKVDPYGPFVDGFNSLST